MNQKDRDHIRTHYPELLEGLKTAIEEVCIYLWKNRIISTQMKEDVLEGRNTDRKRAIALLDLLPTRGPHAYDFLYTAAFNSELFTVADILKPDRAPHQDLADPQFWEEPIKFDVEPCPEYWPSKEALEGIDEKIRLITAKDTNLCQLYSNHLVTGQDSIYTVTHKCRGRAVIINNENFVGGFNRRTGSAHDQRSIQHLFKSFGFEVVCHNDKTSSEMWEVLQKEATNSAHQEADCFILVILSYGADGVVYGLDASCISLKDIRKLFCQVPELQGKPKLFFINASRGGMGSSTCYAADASDKKLGSQADSFLAMSSVQGDCTFRHTQIGTLFIQAVVYIFAHYGYKYEISILMRMVNRLLRRGVKSKGQERNPQICEYISTLEKAFYFFPGLPHNLPSAN